MKKFLNINTLLISTVLIIALIGLWYLNFNKIAGDKAIVQIVGAKGSQKIEIDLSNNKVYKFDAALPVTLEVVDGTIAFINSQCPDKLCEGFGHIRHEGESASCLPAKVVVTIDEASPSDKVI